MVNIRSSIMSRVCASAKDLQRRAADRVEVLGILIVHRPANLGLARRSRRQSTRLRVGPPTAGPSRASLWCHRVSGIYGTGSALASVQTIGTVRVDDRQSVVPSMRSHTAVSTGSTFKFGGFPSITTPARKGVHVREAVFDVALVDCNVSQTSGELD